MSMVSVIRMGLCLFLVVCGCVSTDGASLAMSNWTSPVVSDNGQLAVKGTQLVNQKGAPVVLRGVSFGWSNWWSQFYNDGAVEWLVNDWHCTVVRASMGVGPQGSYLDRPEWSKKLITTVVDSAIKNDVYVIIDWHDHYAHQRTDEAVAFFTEMARRYGDCPNVIYEIYNEPIDASWDEVKKYSNAVISAIRKIDPDNIILVGTPHWDQDIHLAADAPIENQNNLMYSLHFYADTHKQSLRDRADYALKKGLPLFVSEYGGCAANGDGPLNTEEWNRWVRWMEKNKISSVVWSISSKDETCSMLPPEAKNNGNWPPETLKPSGQQTRDLLRKYNVSSGKTIDEPKSVSKGEMLANGGFSEGKKNWTVDQAQGAEAEVVINKEGPKGASAFRMDVVDVGEEPWNLQLYQGNLKVKEDQKYRLTFWVKSNYEGTIKVICMQNHEPWEHSTEQEVLVSEQWKKKEFTFSGPWNDENARITFTDLATDDDRVYWFAKVSFQPVVSQK
ncbi:cellulase family glycosylhydrolase [Mariniblastus sp.]|nr:cellulase family glycosylhydrolase [Mariniblastus sp.]MDC3224831.1 cellulase family glycosylhydrolase [Mariniblastus sp.]